MGNLEHDKKVKIFNNLEDAEELVSRFPSNYTQAMKNPDEDEWFVYIKPIDRHKMTQAERDSMIELPYDFDDN